jgi:predicted transcriptional regulator
MGQFGQAREMSSGPPELGPMNDVKNAVLELAQQLPNECTWDEVMYRIFVRQKIDAGLKDADAGRTISHEDVFEEFVDDDHPVD